VFAPTDELFINGTFDNNKQADDFSDEAGYFHGIENILSLLNPKTFS
jgi:hypothetical protein